MTHNKFNEKQIALIDLAKGVAARLGTKSLSLSEFRANSNISERAIAREFGGWTELCKCAELDIPNRLVELSDDELLDEMRRIFATEGKRVNAARFDALSKFRSKMYCRRWGNWATAVAQLDKAKNFAETSTEVHRDILKTNSPNITMDAMPVSATASFILFSDNAIALVRSAIDLLKQNPTAFLPELAELRRLICSNDAATEPQKTHTKDLAFSVDIVLLAEIARWLLDQESVSFAVLRTYLLPLNLLPSAVIDAFNEHALELTNEPALVESEKETVLVIRKILAQVLACWSVT